jgi:hypothetical protein
MVASLDTLAELHPVANINVESKCSWYEIQDDLPQFSSAPSRREFEQLLESSKTRRTAR